MRRAWRPSMQTPAVATVSGGHPSLRSAAVAPSESIRTSGSRHEAQRRFLNDARSQTLPANVASSERPVADITTLQTVVSDIPATKAVVHHRVAAELQYRVGGPTHRNEQSERGDHVCEQMRARSRAITDRLP